MTLKYICQVEGCGQEFDSSRSMANHCHMHNMTPEEYYRKYLMHDGEDKCKVCSQPTKYKSLGTGFTSYCSMKCKMIAQHKNPEFAKANSDRMRERRRDPEFVKALDESKKVWWTPERKMAIKGYRQEFLEKQRIAKTHNAENNPIL